MERKLFGTDGIRGVANHYPMTSEMMTRLGRALTYLVGSETSKPPKILIGKDTRRSGYLLEYALVSGILSAGGNVLLVGPMPTPAIAHLTKSFACSAGIVISASHNPAIDNGVKIFSGDGFKLSDRVEEELEKLVFEGVDTRKIIGSSVGWAYRVDDARGRYIEFAKQTINSASLESLKIVLDCANGAAYPVAPPIFKELGAEVVEINVKPDGLNINADCGALYPKAVQEVVLKTNADVGVALDGDADRVVFCDARGNIIDGDKIIGLLAKWLMDEERLNKNTVVVTEYSNLGLDKYVELHNGNVLRVKNGDRYVVEALKEKGLNFGGEKSGHVIFFDYILSGDGTITALQVLHVMKLKQASLEELAGEVQLIPQVLKNVRVKEKRSFIEIPELMQEIINAENWAKENNGTFLIRYSGTENICRIMMQGPSEKEIRRIVDNIAKVVHEELG